MKSLRPWIWIALAAGCDTSRVIVGMDDLGAPRDLAGAAPDLAGSDGGCALGLTACGGACVNLQLDPQHCGGCANACPQSQVCSGGACAATCQAPLLLCGSGCVDPRSDLANCGACGVACPAVSHGAPACATGKCGVGSCDPGFADCDAQAQDGCEVQTATDGSNCGQCGKVCPQGQVCSNGACAASCQAPLIRCGTGCVDPRSDAANCGACARVCGQVPHGGGACVASSCTVGKCDPGFADCDGQVQDGCETDTGSDLASCGGCGKACTPAHATAACVAGTCGIASCSAGFADCDGQPGDGCEVATASDANNCGACGNACALANASAVCSGGACAIASCGNGFGDCDKQPGDGCEAALATDPVNCGGCGTVCSLPNASAACAGGSCKVSACSAGFGDCNGVAADGCEASLTTAAHCGSCGNPCGNLQTCVAGSCQSVCSAPDIACGMTCVDPTSDAKNCSGCGLVCPAVTHGVAGCASRVCGIGSCNAGFGDCNGQANDGCETAVSGDVNHCGSCNTVCNPPNGTPTCSGGVCGIGSCLGGYADCDGQAGDGCEANLATDAANCGACGHACGGGHTCQGGSCYQPVAFTLVGIPYDLEASSIAAGDLNGDGKTDLAIGAYLATNSNMRYFDLWLGTGAGGFQGGSRNTATGWNDIALADLSGDGKLDVITANAYAATVGVALGKGDGSAQAQVDYPSGGNFPKALALTDLNGDGKLDVAVTNANGNSVGILLGNGNGTLQAATAVTVGSLPWAITSGDFNGDSRRDLAAAIPGGTIAVLIGNGNGTFAAAASYNCGLGDYGIAAGDTNGDGKGDLVTASYAIGSASVLLGAGNGTFLGATNFPAGTDPEQLVLADFNGDGTLDAALADFAGLSVTLLRGRGDGGFEAAQSFTVAPADPNRRTYDLVVGDFNGDGKPDLATASSSYISLLLNTTP